jgi:PleD family two-component response regulator
MSHMQNVLDAITAGRTTIPSLMASTQLTRKQLESVTQNLIRHGKILRATERFQKPVVFALTDDLTPLPKRKYTGRKAGSAWKSQMRGNSVFALGQSINP